MRKHKKLGIMAAFSHDALLPVEIGASPFLFLQMTPDLNKIYPGQKLYLYEKRSPGYGVAMVVGEAKIKRFFPLVHFPYPEIFRYWAETVKQNTELVEAIDRIGDFRLPGYKPDYTYHFGLFDPEYLAYAKEHLRLPETFNDYWVDYIDHPEHGKARTKAQKILGAYDSWLSSLCMYDGYGRNQNIFCIEVEEVELYDMPREIGEYTMEIRMAPFTRAPQGLMYTWDGSYIEEGGNNGVSCTQSAGSEKV